MPDQPSDDVRLTCASSLGDTPGTFNLVTFTGTIEKGGTPRPQ